MSRKVYVEVKVKLVLNMEEGIEVDTVINEMEYDFDTSNIGGVDVADTEILNYYVTDSK